MIDAFYDAEENGEKLTLTEIGRLSGIKHPANVRWNLEHIGLKAMQWNVGREYHRFSDTEHIIFGELYNTPLNPAETIYFTRSNRSRNKIRNLWSRTGPRLWADTYNAENKRLTYSYVKASQFLEARDYGYGFKESAEIAGIGGKSALSIIDTQEGITKHIIQALDIIEPEIKHTKPYRMPLDNVAASSHLKTVKVA